MPFARKRRRSASEECLGEPPRYLLNPGSALGLSTCGRVIASVSPNSRTAADSSVRLPYARCRGFDYSCPTEPKNGSLNGDQLCRLESPASWRLRRVLLLELFLVFFLFVLVADDFEDGDLERAG